MAELPAQESCMKSMMRKLTQNLSTCNHAIPHNEMIGRLIRNMYGRLQVLEKERKS